MNAFALRAAVAVAVVVIVLIGSGGVTAQEVSVTRLTVGQGASGTVRLGVDDIPAPGLGAWSIDVQYNTAIVSAVGCSSHPSGICNPLFGGGIARSVGASASGLVGDITLATLTFQCKAPGSTSLTLVVHELSDATTGNLQPIAATIEHGAVFCLAQQPPAPTPTPGAGLLGDVNCDGRVQSTDAQLILQLAGGLVLSLPCEDNGDVNNDGRINALDAQLILQYVVGFLTRLG